MKKISNIIVWTTVVVCVVLSGYMFFARFFRLLDGFQYDELYSIATASPSVPLSVIWGDMLLHDINLPLFNILFYGWNLIFPISPLYSHLLGALLGAAAVVAAGVLAPKTWPPLKRFFLVALMSGSFILVIYGVNVRSYSLSVLLATCFTLLALRIVGRLEKQEDPSVTLWLSFLGTGLLGAYSHYFCTASFFSAALIVFLYACYYRRGRAWSFFGTAMVFFLWLPWALHAISVMGGISTASGTAADWWYHTPFMLALSEIFQFLFGPTHGQISLLMFSVVAWVSIIATYRKKLLLHADIMLPLGQIVLLCLVVCVVSLRFNLWMDRYFLPLLPSIFMLLAGLLYHLQERYRIFIVCLPILLVMWVGFYWKVCSWSAPEYTGLHDAFTYLTGPNGPDRVLVDITNTGYPNKALDVMLNYYVPKDSKLKMIALTKQTAPIAWESNPKVPVLMLLCSQVHLIYTAVDIGVEEDGAPMVFGGDTCLFTGHRAERKANGQKTTAAPTEGGAV